MHTDKNISPDNKEEDSLLPLGQGKNNFSVPKDYFEYLPEEIMNSIQAESKRKEKIFLLKPAFIIPSLAILSGIILLIVFFLKKDVSPAEIILTDNEVQQIIDNPELYNIDEADIAEKYLSINLSDDSLNVEATVSDDEIKSYLEDNTDVNNIINEL